MNPKNRILVGVVSATLIAATSQLEGTKYVPYDDVVGVVTVCSGHTGRDVVKGKVYTPEQCKNLLEADLKTHREGINKCINVPLTSYQLDAFTLFSYNVGVNAFCTSKSVAAPLNSGNYKAACDGLLKWTYADGKYVKGLYNRRVYERKMCLGELQIQP
jgi:lysozyme